ncbi:MAG: esterase-like activity of phytase family protein [Hahellaceae bacterium]|nr:esterase-like activity of phytase family protein [Hahellaceae bacterium]MCP5170593.1 esterase-like activity of phytase family protein [Hahellaceae bacterium]
MTLKKILPLFVSSVLATSTVSAAVQLIAVGSIDGNYRDLNTQTAAPLENGVAGNLFGGIGSGLAYAGGTTFLGLPDRGPNANAYNSQVDDTSSYILRFHTLNLNLAPSSPGASLPFVLTPTLRSTTLLSSPTPLVYGSGAGLGVGPGAPTLNKMNHTHYFTGRSDNFDPTKPSTNPANARMDPEGIRVSNNGHSVYVSDEYGPYLYEFNRVTGKRTHAFKLPDNLAITTLSSQKEVEIDSNAVGRTTNKGMEGLAITPDGKTLVGIMQANLKQDKKKSLRIVTIDIGSGVTHEYAYQLTEGSGVSEIVAINNHQFLLDERKGSGFADTPLNEDEASPAKIKQLYLIDLNGAIDVTNLSGDLSAYAVPKTLWLDLVSELNANGIDSYLIPSKIEGVAFGQDVVMNGETLHTLFIANDNDFLGTVADPHGVAGDPARGTVANPNQFYVFGFSDDDLPGYMAQSVKPVAEMRCARKNK